MAACWYLIKTLLLGCCVSAGAGTRVRVVHVAGGGTRVPGHVVTVAATLHVLQHSDAGALLLTLARGYTTPENNYTIISNHSRDRTRKYFIIGLKSKSYCTYFNLTYFILEIGQEKIHHWQDINSDRF